MVATRHLQDWEKAECAALKAEFTAFNAARERGQRLTQEAAGVALGMNQGSVSNYLNGRMVLNLQFAIGISKLLGIPVERFSKRLADEIEQMVSSATPSEPRAAGEAQQAVRSYPLIDWDSVAKRIEEPGYTAPGDGEVWYETLENPGSDGYWLLCQGKAMAVDTLPSFPEGAPLLVQPYGFDLVSGKYYIAHHADGETAFKQYVKDAGVEYLVSLNPSFRPVEMREGWSIVGRVVDVKTTGL